MVGIILGALGIPLELSFNFISYALVMAQDKAVFEVIVGNIGTVYAGNNFMVAASKYSAYVKQSKVNGARASGENVVLIHNGDIRREYIGEIERRELIRQAVRP